MSLALLVGIATLGLGLPASATPAAPSAPRHVNDVSCFVPAPHSFSDVPVRTYYNLAVSWLVEASITSGTGPGVYSPGGKVTRGRMAVFLWNNAGKPAPAGPHGFDDVPTGHFANTAIAWLVGAGITAGTTPSTYSPNMPVARAHMAVFLHRNACTPPDISLAAGMVHTCALKTDATVACWGGNDSGQLGDGTTTGHTTPTPVGGLTNITAIAVGELHTCATAGDGTPRCWGNNYWGQLGDDTTTDRHTPVLVTGL